MAGKIKQAELALTESVAQTQTALASLDRVVEGEENAGGLPEGWAMPVWDEITVGDGFRRGPFGGNLKKSNFVSEGYAVYEQYAPINDDCTQFRYFVTEEKYTELSSFWVNEGDFLVSCSGTMGKITQVPEGAPKGVINQALLRIRLDDKLISDSFFIKLFRSPIIKNQVLNKTVGGAIQNLASVKELKLIEVPLPPLAEQTVIAQTLDTLLAQVDNIKTRLDAIPKILKTFRQSVLAAAVSGKLTEEWREENECGDPQHIAVGKLFNSLDQGWSPKCENTPVTNGQWGVIKTSSVQSGYFVEEENKTLPLELEPRERLALKHNDILITRAGPRTRCGVTCIVQGDHPNLMICDKVYRIRANVELVVPTFLNWCFNSPQYLKDIEVLKTGSSESGMNMTQKKLKELIILVPDLNEQTQIVLRVEELFAFADQVEQQVKNAQKRVNTLTQSILAKAFRGELTAQWRAENPDLITGDNSAEALLANIKEERDALKQKPKPKKKKKTALKKAVVGKK